MDNREVSKFDLDILGEIGNIGAGNAATALSELLNTKVMLEVPLVSMCDLNDVPRILGGSELLRTGVFFGISEALNGYIMFILDDENVNIIHNIVAKNYNIDPTEVITEVGNIISGAYVGAIASMINDKIDLTPPEAAHDMLGSLIDAILSNLCSVADKTVLIGTKLVIGSSTISCFYVLMLEQDSLNKLLDYFNKQKI